MTTTLTTAESRAATLGAVSAKWLAAGLSTQPADRQAAAEAVRLAYRSAGLPEPRHIVWFASPLAGARAAALLTGRRGLPGSPADPADGAIAAELRAQGCPPVHGSAGSSVRAAIRTNPWAAARAEAHDLLGPDGWAGLWSACGADVWRLVNDRIATPLRTHLRGELPAHARAVLLDAVGGQHDAGWLAAFDASAAPAAPASRAARAPVAAASGPAGAPVAAASGLAGAPAAAAAPASSRTSAPGVAGTSPAAAGSAPAAGSSPAAAGSAPAAGSSPAAAGSAPAAGFSPAAAGSPPAAGSSRSGGAGSAAPVSSTAAGSAGPPSAPAPFRATTTAPAGPDFSAGPAGAAAWAAARAAAEATTTEPVPVPGPVFSAGPVGAVWATTGTTPAAGPGEAALHTVQRLAGLAGVARAAGWWWPYANVAILTDRPDAVHRDNIGRLHAADAPALHYTDGYALHAWRGMPIPSDLVDRLGRLTHRQIAAERNAELRRVMLEHFGYERYLREAGARRVAQDETGVLWRLTFNDDEPLVMVEVVNSTPEPDGTSRVYWLRVPPATRSAREGVAWTFGLTEAEYRPLIQT